jgi:hypothetical protein
MNIRLRSYIFALICIFVISPAFGDDGIPDSGSASLFSYRRENPDSEYFLVQPADNLAAEPTAVSENFLKLVLRDGPIDDTTRLKVITQYPQIMAGIYTEKMTANYPAYGVEFDTPFETYEDDSITITQDPLAEPYVRVTLKLPSGDLKTFSLNRDIVESILTDGEISDEKLLDALQTYPYRLPEQARPGFEYLTASNIFEMAEQDVEGVKGQEFVKTRQWYKRRQEMRDAAALRASPSQPQPQKPAVSKSVAPPTPAKTKPANIEKTAPEKTAKKKPPQKAVNAAAAAETH